MQTLLHISDLFFFGLILFWFLMTMFRTSPYVIAIPKFWYKAVTLGWLIVIRKRDYSEELLVHEYIHFQQQKETLLIFGYLIYFFELIIKSIYLRSIKKGYFAISFEQEARLFQSIGEYPFTRKPFAWRHFIKMSKVLSISVFSTEEQFSAIYALKKAQVFKFTGDYATIDKILQKNKPENSEFKYLLIKPGTSLYSLYGNKTLIVTREN